jgi:hypothetical protein
MKFRKKPVEIEAVQFKGFVKENKQVVLNDNPDWVQKAFNRKALYIDEADKLSVRTLEGVMRVSVGDWIIKGVKGELYPCKPDIFDATYDEVKLGKGA